MDASFLNSVHSRSHSGDTIARMFEGPSDGNPKFLLQLLTASGIVAEHEFSLEDALDLLSTTPCIQRNQSGRCLRGADLRNGEIIDRRGIAYGPGGKRVYPWFMINDRTETVGPPEPCAEFTCRDVHRTRRAVRTDVYELELESGDSKKLWSVPDAVLALGVSEDGKEMGLSRAVETTTIDSEWDVRVESDGDLQPFIRSHLDFADDHCTVEFRDAEDGAALSRAPLDDLCWEIVDGSSTTFDLPLFAISP